MDEGLLDTPPIVVFDIGGTWFRSAIVDASGELQAYERVQAASVRQLPQASLKELQRALVDYLVEEGRRLVDQAGADRIVVSIGAAIDARRDRIVGAAPLWGATEQLDFDLSGRLAEALPGCVWTIVNDVTAAAFGVATYPEYRRLQRIAVLTVSSGLGMRTIEPATGRVPLSKLSGLQGEVGHLPAYFAFDGVAGSRVCGCGASDHLSAFSSGHAIEAMLEELAEPGAWIGSGDALVENLSEAIAAGSSEARRFLHAVVAPLARALLTVLTVDAEIELIVLTGGVVDGLGDHYMEALHAEMAAHGLYGSQLKSPSDFASLVRRFPGSNPNMRGAASWGQRATRTEIANR